MYDNLKLNKMTKICTRCKQEKPIEDFRKRPFGFILNQCKKCENEMNKERRVKKISTEVLIITKSGREVKASTTPILGGRMTTSSKTDKVLYFDPMVNRDTARMAFSNFAGVERTGVNYQKI